MSARLGTELGMLQYPCAEDALALIASEEAETIAVLVRSMPGIWARALIEECVRVN
jgi:hypothetical protein